MDLKKCDKESLIQMMLQNIQGLEKDGLVDENFRDCYSLKETSGPAFFLDIITVFLLDAGKAIREMKQILNQPIIDSKALHFKCTKLNGSALCMGACTIRDGCGVLLDEIKKESIQGCFQALETLDNEQTNLYNRSTIIMKIEHELISRD